MERWLSMTRRFNTGLAVTALVVLTMALLSFVASAAADESGSAGTPDAAEQSHAEDEMTPDEAHAKMRCWAFLAAAAATGIGSLAAGHAVGQVGTAAMGAIAEKPELMGKSLIYVALAEGIAIYGLLISIIVLAKV